MVTKLYCVHVHPRAYVYENVRAADPEAAEWQIVGRQFAGDYDDIARIEVRRQCACGLDNALDQKTCADCGAPL